MTTRPTHDTTPEDASLSRWMIDVEQFIDELIGSEAIPPAPAELTLESDKNSVKIKFRAVNEVGVSEYQIFRSSEKNFSSAQSELIATVPQAVEPATTTIVFSDAEAIDKQFYFVRAVKGRRIPKIVGPVIGFGSSISGEQLGEGEGLLGIQGTPGSILFINDDQNIDEDNENLFWDQQRKRVVLGPDVDLSWGAVHRSPDLILTRDGADILAQVRKENNQKFRVYETFDSGVEERYVEITGLGASGTAEVMTDTVAGAVNRALTIGTRDPGILNLATDNVARWRVLVNGNLEPLTDALYDIAAPGSQVRDFYLGESFIQSDPEHSHVVGGALLDHAQFRQTGLFLSGGGSTFSTLLLMDGSLVGADGDTDFLSGTTLRSSMITQGNSETLSTVSQLRLEEPNIILGAGDNILRAATLHIVGEPTEGDENFSMLVSTGLSRLRDLDLEGDEELLTGEFGNDISGRLTTVGRNINAGGPEGGAPGVIELISADGTSCFIWCKNDGALTVGPDRPTGSTGSPTVPSEIGGVVVTTPSVKSYSFESPSPGAGTFFVSGFYDFDEDEAALDQGPPPGNTSVTHGQTDHPYGAHASLIAGGAGTASGGAGTVEIEVSGTSFTDAGVRTPSDTEILVADITTLSLNDYIQTIKKWIGPVTFTIQNSSGSTHTTFALNFNFGFARIEDFGGNNFNVDIFDFEGLPGANDSDFNVELLHHNDQGWTFAATGFVAGGTVLVDFAADYSTESDLDNGIPFAYQRIDIDTLINVSNQEGLLIRITAGANQSIKEMNLHISGLFT